MHYRLGKINERLGDHRAAQASYQEAIRRWEKLSQERPDHADYLDQLHEGRQRMQSLAQK